MKKRKSKMQNEKMMKLAADTVRLLSADAIQKAKSGHPGMPMGCADLAIDLWFNHMRHNPKNPKWLGRDRFVLSAGHGSMLIYSLLHLFGYGLTIDDLKGFRQWDSLTPGHPEYKHTAGVEVTTGPLGTGFASGIGMAVASKYTAAVCGMADSGLLDSKVYIISGDGCMMEGITHEAASFAGHQKLDNVVVFYDSNCISIEGSTSIAFTEDVAKRFEAYDWRVLVCENANDFAQIDAAISKAKVSDGRPTLVVCKTTIGFGSPAKAGKASSHGEPLGEEELAATKKALGFPAESFYVPAEVSSMMAKRVAELEKEAASWDAAFQSFSEKNPEKIALLSKMMNKEVPADLTEQLLKAAPMDKPVASRASSGAVLQKASELVPALYGGAADLAPSTKTNIKNSTDFCPENRAGKNFHFGVREMAMGFIANGMTLYGAAIAYCSTFFVFSDFMKPAVRLAALQGLPVIYVFTHDSFYVGEDGPTHEPIEQLAMLRTIPGMTVLRPAEATEVAHAWSYAITCGKPAALILTRQDLRPYDAETARKVDIAKGAYAVSSDEGFEYLLIATGSEVNLALDAAALLRAEGKKVRVVSMPSWELFEAQSKEYKDSVIPPCCKKRVTIEAASTFGWAKYAGDEGLSIGLDHFGASAPYKVLAEKFGFTAPAVAAKIKEHFGA
ncbi:MAG: transketolase [Lentisphaeria bacterium]|nr:transketolase [Lentisphaeria bacterium]